MKTVKYKFSQEFQYHGMSRWLTSYAVLSPFDNPEDAAKELIKQSAKIIQEVVKQQAEEMKGKITGLDQIEEDFKFNDVKKRLAEFEFREDAQAYLESEANEYQYTIEAKKIVNSKPNKQ